MWFSSHFLRQFLLTRHCKIYHEIILYRDWIVWPNGSIKLRGKHKWTTLFFKLPVLWLQALFFPLTYNVPDSTAGYLRSKKKTERQRLNWFVRVNATKTNSTPITKNYEDSLLTRKKRWLLQTHFCIFPKYQEGTSTVLCS